MTEKSDHPGDFRHVLRQQLDARVRKNPQYSLRAFARDIELPANRLSEILSGKQGMSRQVANRVVRCLNLPPDDAEFFCDSVDAMHARSHAQKAAARQRVDLKAKHRQTYNALELDQFRTISEWYHLAILELVNMQGFQGDAAWIAKRLKISLPEAFAAVERLVRLNLLTRNTGGEWMSVHKVNETEQRETPSEYVRSFHRRVIRKAVDALENQPVTQREYSTLFLSVKSADIPAAKLKIREFWRGFCEEFNCPQGADSVYSLAMQFFEITHPEFQDA